MTLSYGNGGLEIYNLSNSFQQPLSVSLKGRIARKFTQTTVSVAMNQFDRSIP